eukprot:526542_1
MMYYQEVTFSSIQTSCWGPRVRPLEKYAIFLKIFGENVISECKILHELEGEMRQNRGPKQILDLLPCYFCGKQSYNQCGLQLYLPSGKKANFVIRTSCLNGYISGRFYSKLLNLTRKLPFVNNIVKCTLCEFIAWLWNMYPHYMSKHQEVTVPSKYVVSKFEEKCVEYVSLNGYLPDNKYNLLYSEFENETVELFGDRQKEKAEKKKKAQQKKKNKKRKKKKIGRS